MIWQPLFLLLITVALGVSGLLIQFYLGARKVYQASFAKREFISVARAMSNHVASSSGSFLYTVQTKLKAKLVNPAMGISFKEDLENLSREHSLAAFNNSSLSPASVDVLGNPLAGILLEGTNTEGFISKYMTNTELPLKYEASLIQSKFLEVYPLETSNKYLATLIDSTKIDHDLGDSGSSYEAAFLDEGEKLLISEELLSSLLEKEAFSEVKNRAGDFSLSISDNGLKLEDLPTGLKLSVEFPVTSLGKDKPEILENSDKTNQGKDLKDTYKTLELIANSQLRLSEKVNYSPVDIPNVPEAPVNPPEPPPVNPFVNPLVPADSNSNHESYFDLMIRSLPSASHGILFNPETAISETNPLRIANSRTSGLTSLYLEEHGYLNISIGSAKDSESLSGFSGNEANFTSSKIGVLETFNTSGTTPALNAATNTALNSINNENPALILDALPRQNKRYGTVDEPFKYQGISIPAGAVVVATKEAGINDNRPEIEDFSYFKVYDSNGALVTQFHIDNLSDKSKLNNLSFSYTAARTEDRDGSAIYQSFSTADLFKGQSAEAALKAFLNIQADLASTQQLNINEQRKDWHEDLYGNFKSNGVDYTGATLETNDPKKAAEILIAEKVYISEKAKELDKKQVMAMLELEAARDLVEEKRDKLLEAKEDGKSKKEIKEIKLQIEQAEKERAEEKKELVEARDKYDDYMANRAKEEKKVATKQGNETKSNAASQPKASPAPQVISIQSAPKVTVAASSGGGKRK